MVRNLGFVIFVSLGKNYQIKLSNAKRKNCYIVPVAEKGKLILSSGGIKTCPLFCPSLSCSHRQPQRSPRSPALQTQDSGRGFIHDTQHKHHSLSCEGSFRLKPNHWKAWLLKGKLQDLQHFQGFSVGNQMTHNNLTIISCSFKA